MNVIDVFNQLVNMTSDAVDTHRKVMDLAGQGIHALDDAHDAVRHDQVLKRGTDHGKGDEKDNR